MTLDWEVVDDTDGCVDDGGCNVERDDVGTAFPIFADLEDCLRALERIEIGSPSPVSDTVLERFRRGNC